MLRKKSPHLAAAFVVTISAGCGGSTPPPDDSKAPEPVFSKGNDGACYLQYPANPPLLRQVDCETRQPLPPKTDEPKPPEDPKPAGSQFATPPAPSGSVAETPKPPDLEDANLPDAPAGWRVERTSDGRCTAYASMACPSGARCNPPPPRRVKCSSVK